MRPAPGDPRWWRRPSRFAARVPLRVKLVVAVLVVAVAGLVTVGMVAATALRGYLMNRVDDQLRSAPVPVLAGPVPGPPGSSVILRVPTEYVVLIVDPRGAVDRVPLGPADVGAPRPDLTGIDPAAITHRAGIPFTVDSTGGGAPWRVIARPLRDGSGSSVVGLSLADTHQTVDRLVAVEIGVGVVVVVLLGVLGYAMVRRSLRPLVEVERTAAAIAHGDLSRRVPDWPVTTEVGRLAAALNGMLTQIESAVRVRESSAAAARESERGMRQFIGDASHELRTPLTSILGFAQLYRQGAVTDVARVMDRIESESTRMGVLVDDLLLLASLDQRRPLERAPVDLLAVAADAVHDGRAVASDREIALRVVDGSAPPVVLGDEARLRQVVANLLSNALAYTPDGSPVTVTVATAKNVATVAVADQGPGLSDENARRVFERFYRADPARGRGGTGLGLSIVAALVAAHGGSVDLDTAPGRGATFRVSLPVANVESPPGHASRPALR